MPHLLDTNILSELRKTHPDRRVARWYATVPDDSLYLSVLVIGEIHQGIERLRRRDDDQARALDEWLETLKSTYADRIIPVTTDVAEEWAG
jgi:hypothetical protein